MSESPSSTHDLLRRVVFDYVRYGYVRVSIREIPSRKVGEVERIDVTMRDTYGVTDCRMTRMRRRRRGEASIAYLRFRRSIVLLSTDGTHAEEGRIAWHDIREKPLTMFGYRIGIRHDGKPWVRIGERKERKIRSIAHQIALHNEAKVTNFIAWMQKVIAFQPPGVREEIAKIVGAINHRRGAAGLPKVK